ncbi:MULTISPECIES: CATRA conflict system CASPASE/TPR repeat-associated protein [Catenuloplanes]|uniref:Guanylate cyclase domain-containing protein n=1 Tax=Catenuloplanes niger TaxID=587534 RepID=A0AAE4CWK6_9ACTN|nr:CATRA conflict system CASPASE/TPR repeat-associated protein [Catenuloplanes niger]MDR7325633.1 hypothetical protein [Catenuloplanes niger]
MTSLVLHAFAPLDGPAAPHARHQIQLLWAACGDVLGMDARVPGSRLRIMPSDWRGGPRVAAIAARERPGGPPPGPPVPGDDPHSAGWASGGGFRAILRRDRDVLVLSAVLTGAGDTGWVELDRWLDDASAGGVDALIGTARVYRASSANPARPPDRAALPQFATHAGWQDDRIRFGDRACGWELSPRQDTRRERRLVVTGPEPSLSALTWGSGEDELPPLARYLRHAGVLRYLYRIWTGDQRRIGAMREPGVDRSRLAVEAARLSGMFGTATGALRELSAAAAAARSRGDGGLDLVTDDRRFGHWLTRQLDDASTALENLRRTPAGPTSASAGAPGAGPVHHRPPASREAPPAGHRATAPGPAPGTAPPAGSPTAPGTTSAAGRSDPATTDPASTDPASTTGRSGTAPAGPPPGEAPPVGSSAGPWTGVPDPAAEPPHPSRPGSPQHALRMLFTVDAVGYSTNDADGRDLVQRRILHVVTEALAEMHLALTDTDRQVAGDGLSVILPANIDLPRALAQLLHGTAVALRAERGRYAAPLRLRMGVSIGKVRPAVLGYSDFTIIETNRLVDSAALRTVLDADPALLLAALISDRLYPFTVAEGHARLAPTDFAETPVMIKSYKARAWLWTPR